MKIYKTKQHLLDTINDFDWNNNRCVFVDWSNPNDVEQALRSLKSRLGEFRSSSRKEDIANQLVNIQKIYETDISHLYSDLDDNTDKYYVYAHCDPSKRIVAEKGAKTTFAAMLGMKYRPFYIGKGTGDRAYDTKRNGYHQKINKKLSGFDQQIDVVILKDGLTSGEAFALESKLIDIFDLQARGGMLVNLDEGKSPDERRSCYMEELCEISGYWREFHKV